MTFAYLRLGYFYVIPRWYPDAVGELHQFFTAKLLLLRYCLRLGLTASELADVIVPCPFSIQGFTESFQGMNVGGSAGRDG